MICDIMMSVKRCWRGAFRSAACVIGLLLISSHAWAQETVVYYHTDGVGSVRVVTDSGGTLLHHRDYLPFGEPWPSNPPFERRGFAGTEKDTETTLNYVGARHYASLSGRFTTVDPILNVEAALTDPQRWNRYSYVANRPLANVDPDGRDLVIASRYSEAQFARNAALRQWAYTAVGATPDANPFTRFLGQLVVDSILAGFFPVNTGEEAEAATAALMGAGTPAGGAVRRGVQRLGEETAVLTRDATGKIHRALPGIDSLKRGRLDDIVENIGQLRESIRIRKLELKRLGEHSSHRRRIGEEERLLRSLEGYLEDLYGARNQP